MREVLRRTAAVLRLTRLSTGFAAVANVWFVVLWSRAEPAERLTAPHEVIDRPLWLLLLGGVAAGAGIYAFGACLNDVLDVRRDRLLRPDRPIAAGTVPSELAVVGVAGTLLAGVLGAAVFGVPAVVATVLVAAGALVFNLLGKFIPGIGTLLLALLYAGHLLAPNLWLRFLWPVWLVMTHALVVAGLAHRLSGRSPPLSRRAVGFAVTGWIAATGALALLAWQRGGLWPEGLPYTTAIAPFLLAVLFAVFVVRKIATLGVGQRSAEKVARYGALWLSFYGVAWLLGARHTEEGIILGALAAAAVITMTTLREAYGLLEHPIGYRR